MKKKNNKLAGVCFLVASICYFISAILCFFNESNKSTAVTNLCLGSCFLCLYVTINNQNKEK